MNIWQRMLNRVLPQRPSGERVVFLGRTQSGQYVDEDSALKLGVLWACVDIRAKAVAILPWSVFQRTKTGRKEDSAHALQWLLHNQPNPEMTPYQFKHLLVAHRLLWGNAYCEIERDRSGRVMWLWPITPDRVRVDRDQNGVLFYRIRNAGTGDSIIEAEDMLHFRGMGFDGTQGYSVIRYAAQTIGLGMAMEEFGSSFFGNGANPGLILEHPKTLSPTATKNLEESVQRRSGGKNSQRPFVAEEGMKVHKLTVPPEEAQFVQSRNVNVLDICRWFCVPPHKVAALDRATYNNIEHQGIEFVTDAVLPDVTQMEEEVNLKCFGRQQRGVLYTKMNLAALLRGDMKARYESYQIGHQNGWLNADEIRSLEEMNPIPSGLGKLYIVPSNFTTRERMKVGEPAKPARPAVEPEPDDDSADDPQDRFRESIRARVRANGRGHA